MTTEDDFHRILDANPDDHHTRLVLADFLQDRGDPRAAGYRALGKLKRKANGTFYRGWTHEGNVSRGSYPDSSLPHDWWSEIDLASQYNNAYWKEAQQSRKAVEDAAALAFAKLPPERQSELLRDPEQMSRRMRAKRLSRAK